MVQRYRGQMQYQVDWEDNGNFTGALDDVTLAMRGYGEGHGTARNANPQRPTIAPGSGSLTLGGMNYLPGRSTALTADQLRARHRFRQRWRDASGGNAVTIFDGFVSDPGSELTSDNRTTFQLEGQLEREMRMTRELMQPDTMADTDDAAVLVLFAQSVGQSSVSPVELDARALASYSFDGPGGRYASLFAQVAGGYPVAQGGGGIGLVSGISSATPKLTLSNASYVISRVETRNASDHLRNRGVVNFATETFAPSAVYQVDSDGPVTGWQLVLDSDLSIGIDLPEMTGFTYDRFRFTLEGVEARVITNSSLSGTTRTVNTFDWIDTWVTTQLGGLGGNDPTEGIRASLVKPMGGTDAIVITVPNPNTRTTWQWQAVQIQSGVTTPITGLANVYWTGGIVQEGQTYTNLSTGWLFGYRLRYSYEYDRIPTIPQVVVTNPASIAVWDQRTIEYPAWFRSGVTAGIQDDIDDLAQPRHIHTVDVPLHQPTLALSKDIAELDAGDYINLVINDGITGASINEHALIMHVATFDGARTSPRRRLTLLETGNPIPPDPVFVQSTSNPLYVEDTGNRVHVR